MSRCTLGVCLVLSIVVSATAFAQQGGKPLINRNRPSKSPVTPSSIGDGPIKSETTRLDPVAQLEIAVHRLEKENAGLKAQISALKTDSDSLKKDIASLLEGIRLSNEGPGGVQRAFASRKQIVEGTIPDDASFRVWFGKSGGYDKPDRKFP